MGRIDFPAFYLRRTVRIVPPMLICYAVALALGLAGLVERPLEPAGIVWDLLFLTNYTPLIGPGSQIPIPLWSLDVEEHFYLLFPAIFAVLLRKSWGRRFAVVAALVVLALILRFVAQAAGYGEDSYYWTHTRYDSILFGVLLTLILTRRGAALDTARSHPAGFLIGLALIAASLVIRDEVFRNTLRYTVQGIGLLLVFHYVVARPASLPGRVLSHRALKVVADYSYVLYLIHLPILTALHVSGLPLPPAVLSIAGFALSFAFAAAMHRYVEQPLLRWRQRVQKGWQPTPAMQPKGVE